MFKKFILGLTSSLIALNISTAIPLMDGEVSVGYIQQKPDGWLQYKGDRIDLKDNLGLDNENKFFAKAKIEHPIPLLPNIYLQYTPMKFTGDKINVFRFDNKVFAGNVHTELQLDHYDIGFYYNVPMLSALTANVFEAELGLIIRIIDFQAKVSTVGQSSTTDFTAPIPLLYGSLTINPFEFLSIVGEAKGISYNSNFYYDFSGEVRYQPVSAVVFKPFVAVGYKLERLRIDNVSDVYSDIKIKQPYISIGISF